MKKKIPHKRHKEKDLEKQYLLYFVPMRNAFDENTPRTLGQNQLNELKDDRTYVTYSTGETPIMASGVVNA